MQIVFNIKTEVAIQIADKLAELHKIPQVPVDPEDPSKGTKPQYTKEQWVKRLIKQYIISQYNRQIMAEERDKVVEGLLKEEDIFE